jgi:hypothetical protein
MQWMRVLKARGRPHTRMGRSPAPVDGQITADTSTRPGVAKITALEEARIDDAKLTEELGSIFDKITNREQAKEHRRSLETTPCAPLPSTANSDSTIRADVVLSAR